MHRKRGSGLSPGKLAATGDTPAVGERERWCHEITTAEVGEEAEVEQRMR